VKKTEACHGCPQMVHSSDGLKARRIHQTTHIHDAFLLLKCTLGMHACATATGAAAAAAATGAAAAAAAVSAIELVLVNVL